MKSREETLRSAYIEFCRELSKLLYEEDPAMMGRTVGAPPDEYDSEAARLASSLRDAQTRDQVSLRLQEMFGPISDAVVTRVDDALAVFRRRIKSMGRSSRDA